MDVRTRIKLARFSRKIKDHPDVARSMGATFAVMPKATKIKKVVSNGR